MANLNYNRKTNRIIDYWNYPKKTTKANLSDNKYVMPFGKYKGYSVKKINEIDPSYIKWLKNTL